MLPAPSLFPEPGLAGPMREVLLTPETTEGDDELGRRGGMRRRMRQRMRERMQDQEPDEELLEGDEDLAGDDELGRRGGRGGRGRGRGRQMRQRMRQRMQQRQHEPEDEEALEGDDFGRRGRPGRGRFVRAHDDNA